MRSMQTSRRAFVIGSAGSLLAAAGLSAQAAPLTAQQIIDRIKTALGPPKPGNTVDGFKAGDPSTVVTGIATTSLATVGALRRAVDAQANLIITHEPVFYTANDDPGPRASDPVYLAKKKLIDDQKLVVYRLTDQWLANLPNAFSTVLARNLGGRAVAGLNQIYETQEKPLSALVPLRNIPGSRVVGDPNLKVRRFFVAAGTTTLVATMAGLQHADVVIAGEPREWEAVPYVLDAIAAGQQKGMILVGRIVSEDPGMGECAEWIRGQVPSLAVKNILTPDPYWKAS